MGVQFFLCYITHDIGVFCSVNGSLTFHDGVPVSVGHLKNPGSLTYADLPMLTPACQLKTHPC